MSYNKTAKANQKTHRERSQLSSRAHLGFLEKKKDYKLRADDFQKKQRTLTALKRKALDKNPDEFYFKMVKTKLEDGVHQSEDKLPEYTDAQLKLIQTQDLNYVNYKHSTETKKIDKLKGSLHLLDVPDKPKNKHVIFVDTKKQASKFDAARYLNTHPALLSRAYNRPTMEMLQSGALNAKLDDDTLAEMAAKRGKKYQDLERHIEREKQLRIVAQKLETKKHLKDKKAKKEKVADETTERAAQYKWAPCRKK